MTDRFFPLGASYYPPHHDEQDWARDVARMAEAGMTCIRSAELLASWDYIEKVRRAYGKGQTFYVGTHLDAAALLLALAESAGPRPPLMLDAAPATVDAHLLLAGERRLIVLTNNGARATQVRVGIRGVAFDRAAELLQGSALTVAEDHLSVAIELAPWGGAVILLA